MNDLIGIVGCGTMGSGIAQAAVSNGERVLLFDAQNGLAATAIDKISSNIRILIQKKKLREDAGHNLDQRLIVADKISGLQECSLVLEAAIEDLETKRTIAGTIEECVDRDCIIGTNTSSLSITAIASRLKHPTRLLGIHFFNPAPVMRLVEVVRGLVTADSAVERVCDRMHRWSKLPIVVKDTPGFVVNRVARPFYGEALRMVEEGLADVSTIDWAMKEVGGFKMGPFELMDLIGNDVNYAVTESMFRSMYNDPRYLPSMLQRRLVDAGWLGQKSGKGFYDYAPGAVASAPKKDQSLGDHILNRILAMIINEAAELVRLSIAAARDVDVAMKEAMRYPRGPLEWADHIGLDKIAETLTKLYEEYHEDRYRLSPLLKKIAKERKLFYSS
jgi:3-hydroxybutyryl-CoA dehydrogenase